MGLSHSARPAVLRPTGSPGAGGIAITNDGAWLICCPYTDQELPKSKTNSEHIIPLALGGVNGFNVHVDRDFNSQLGSELDGSLANEFLWALRRTEYDARGHSGREPVATSYGRKWVTT